MAGVESLIGAAAGSTPYGAAAEGVLGAVELGIGLINEKKAKKKADELAKSRPRYKESASAKEDVNLAESDLAKGMSSKAEKAYLDANDRQLSASLSAILKGGGSTNNVGDVFGKSEIGKANLAMMQDNLRLNQINNVVRTHQYKDEQDDKAFMYNEDAPWKDAAQANAAARQQSANMVQAGFNTLGAGAINYAGTQTANNDYSKYWQIPGGNTSTNTLLDNGSVAREDSQRTQGQTLSTPLNIYNQDSSIDTTLPDTGGLF